MWESSDWNCKSVLDSSIRDIEVECIRYYWSTVDFVNIDKNLCLKSVTYTLFFSGFYCLQIFKKL